MREKLKTAGAVLVLTALFAAVITAAHHANKASKAASACEDKAIVQRAINVCASSGSCVITLADAEHLVRVALNCNKT